jgi:predicted outer membrane repeat protein
LIKDKANRVWLFKILALAAMLFIFASQSHGADITLEWDANTESNLAGYRVYYKMDSSGERILDNYTGEGLVLIEESGTTRVVNSGFETSGVTCHLSGLAEGTIHFFVVTAFNTEGFESLASREVSTDYTPPSQPIVLSITHTPDTREVAFEWSPSTDPFPGSGLAGYSCILDPLPDTTPAAIPNLGLVTEATFSVPFDGFYWFHIRAVDKAGPEGPNASATEHYGPICIDTGPPAVDYVFIDYVENNIYVIYSETHMQNAALADNYSFSDGLLLLGDGTDVSGVSRVFTFPLDPGTLDRYLIYTMTVSANVFDATGNPLPATENAFTMNDDDGDGMADEWERLWFGDIWSEDGTADTDGDGILDGDEYSSSNSNPQWGTDRWTLSPLDFDSDHDSIPDGYEIQNGLNPTNGSDGPENYAAYIDSLVVPLINAISDSSAVEGLPYTGPAPSLSQGSLPVTWSLVAGPQGMEIDPVTGEVYWALPTPGGSTHTVIIRAANLRGACDQTWQLTVVPGEFIGHVSAYYGNDVTGNGTRDLPWRTIGFALSKAMESLSPSGIIRVAAGRYMENIAVQRRGIELQGGWKGVFAARWNFLTYGVEPTSKYEAIIDGQNLGSAIVAGADTTIDGFTITRGYATNGGGVYGADGITVRNCKITGNSADMGGGMYLEGFSATVTNCLFVSNSAKFGGGIYTRMGYQVISSCTFRANSADTGGGIFNSESSPSIENCLFAGNTYLATLHPAYAGGGGIANESSYPYIGNCTFSGNVAGERGGAIGNFAASMSEVKNCILWGNIADVSGNEIHNDETSTALMSFCDVEGAGGSGSGWNVEIGIDYGGNIDAPPLFVDPTNGNYHLQYLSPCIDAGDPASDYSQEPQPNGGRMNMGAYGGTAQATTTIDSDLDGLADIVENVLGTNPFDADTDKDGVPDGLELSNHHTDPLNPDTDGDGLIDGREAAFGRDPNLRDQVFGLDSANVTNPFFPLAVDLKIKHAGKGSLTGYRHYYQILNKEVVDTVECVKMVQRGHGKHVNPDLDPEWYYVWLAQDTSGVLWLLKEYDALRNTYRVLGKDNAVVWLPADPVRGQRFAQNGLSYREVVETDVTVEPLNTGLGPYTGSLKIKWTDGTRDDFAYFAPNVGIVTQEWLDGATTDGWEIEEIVEALFGDEVAADFGVSGLWHYGGSLWNKLTEWDADEFLSWGQGRLLAKFSKYGLGNGLWNYDGAAWNKLTDWVPESTVVLGPGEFLGTFTSYGTGNGLWRYNGVSWSKLTGWVPESMLVTGTSQFVGKFTAYGSGNGLWHYDGATWRKLTEWLPRSMLSIETNQFLCEFRDYGAGDGVWRYDGSSWAKLTEWLPDAIVPLGGGQFVARFSNYGSGNGLWRYNGSSWAKLTEWVPDSIIKLEGGEFVASFSNYTSGNGLWRYNGSSWSKLTEWLPDSIIKLESGEFVASFSNYTSGNGVWRYNGSSWAKLTEWLPEVIVPLSDGQFTCEFSNYGVGNGLWKYDGTGWSQLTTWLPETMKDVNLQ